MYWSATWDSRLNSAAVMRASTAFWFARAAGTPKMVFPSSVHVALRLA